MNPIEQLALAAMQRATETKAADESSAKSTTSAEGQDRPDTTEARVALRKERNRQSAASSRKRAKHRTEELEEENNSLRAENEKLRRMLAGYSLAGVINPSAMPGTAGGSSHAETAEIDLGAVTTTTTPLNSPPLGPLDEPSDCLQETRVLLPAPTNKRPPTSALEAEVVMPSSYKSLATAVESA